MCWLLRSWWRLKHRCRGCSSSRDKNNSSISTTTTANPKTTRRAGIESHLGFFFPPNNHSFANSQYVRWSMFFIFLCCPWQSLYRRCSDSFSVWANYLEHLFFPCNIKFIFCPCPPKKRRRKRKIRATSSCNRNTVWSTLVAIVKGITRMYWYTWKTDTHILYEVVAVSRKSAYWLDHAWSVLHGPFSLESSKAGAW